MTFLHVEALISTPSTVVSASRFLSILTKFSLYQHTFYHMYGGGFKLCIDTPHFKMGILRFFVNERMLCISLSNQYLITWNNLV